MSGKLGQSSKGQHPRGQRWREGILEDRDGGEDTILQKRIKVTVEHALTKVFNPVVTTLQEAGQGG